VLEHLVDVAGHNLEACDDQGQFKVRHSLFHLLNNFVDDIYLFGEAHRLEMVIEEHPADVTKFHCEHVLLKAGIYYGF
jgi:hypothetical protein